MRLDKLRAELKLKREQLAEAEARLLAQEKAFEQRIVLTYKASDLSYLDVLLNSTSFEDLVSRLRVVQDMIGGENDLVGQLEATRNEVEAERDAVQQDETEAARLASQLEEKRSELAALKAAQEAQRLAVVQARAAKRDKLRAVEHNLAPAAPRRGQPARPEPQVSPVSSTATRAAGTARARWCGRARHVVSGFGCRIHPILHTRRMHTGIDIAAGMGVAIVAADAGKVIYATWMSGYGNTTIIDHGGGISTPLRPPVFARRLARRDGGQGRVHRRCRQHRLLHGATPALRGERQRLAGRPDGVPALTVTPARAVCLTARHPATITGRCVH